MHVFACMYVGAPLMCLIPAEAKRASDALEFQIALSSSAGAEN